MGRWVEGSPVWHLCVIVHVFGYVSSTHVCGPMVSANSVGGSPPSSHACDDTSVPWCVLHICMSVSNVAGPCGCLPVSQQIG